jgi:hypothetical protein
MKDWRKSRSTFELYEILNEMYPEPQESKTTHTYSPEEWSLHLRLQSEEDALYDLDHGEDAEWSQFD